MIPLPCKYRIADSIILTKRAHCASELQYKDATSVRKKISNMIIHILDVFARTSEGRVVHPADQTSPLQYTTLARCIFRWEIRILPRYGQYWDGRVES